MHAEAYEAVRKMSGAVESAQGADGKYDALDLGGQYVNGSCRDLFPNARWTGLDIVPGPGIDVVSDATTWTPDKLYSLVLCTEVLEHVQDWRAIVRTAASALNPGGMLVLTCASTDRPEHGANGEPTPAGQWYRNVGPDELEQYAKTLLGDVIVQYNYPPGDAYLLGVKL